MEAQQAEAEGKTLSPRTRLSREDAARERSKESLKLARQRVLQQLQASENARHRRLLEDALADLEEKLNKLEACVNNFPAD